MKAGRFTAFFILVILLISGQIPSFSQTDPAPFNLGGGNYTLATWPSGSAAGTYPLNMRFHTCPNDSNPALADPTGGDYTGAYNLGTGNRFAGLNAIGIGMFNSVKTPTTVGAIVLGLNSTGRTNITATFTARTNTTGNAYNIRLQYRLSTASPWLDVPGPVEYVFTGVTGAASVQNFTVNLSAVTANAVDNRPDMQIRWKYYYVSGFVTASCNLAVGNISITSAASSGNSIATGLIAGSPYCVTPTTGIAVNIPFTYFPTANFPGGTVFTAELSNSSGIFTTPTSIGTVLSNGTGSQTIAATIPANTGTGTAYRIRVVCNSPLVTGSDNGTDLIIRLSPSDANNAVANPANASATITWTLPLPCYSEVMVVAKALNPVTGIPVGNGAAYTSNTVFGAGTAFGGGFTVYKGGGSSVTVTGLTNGTLYYFKIFTRYGTEWSGGTEVFCTPGAGTLLKRGDFVVVGVNANNQACVGGSGPDEISFICFRDITTFTTLDMTDNGWERLVANRWGNTEGIVRMTRTGGLIPAGTVITIRFDGTGTGSAVSPDANWSFATLQSGVQFNLNNGGDQFFFMQGGNWVQGTAGSHNAQYTGTILFAFNSSSAPWTSFANTTQQSGLYPFLDCYTVKPGVATDFFKYVGNLATARTQRAWVDHINDNMNWLSYSNCTNYNAAVPQYPLGASITILPGGYQRGKWLGSKNTNWFTCDNWEDFVIPDSLTDVNIPSSGVTNICRLQKDSVHYCRNLLIEGYELNGEDTSSRVLRIYGNMTMTAGLIDFSDNNPNTADGTIYIKGNWTNYDEAAFRQGNSSVILNGTGLQTINTPVNEIFWNLETNNISGASIGSPLNIENRLTLTNGLISTGTNEVYITNTAAASVISHSAISYINGNLRRQISTSGIYDFPVGTSNDYELATLNISSQSGISNIAVDFDNPSGGALPNPAICQINGTDITGMLNAGSWTIKPNTIPAAINYGLTLKMRGHGNSVAPASRYGIIRRDDIFDDWMGAPIGIHNNATQSEIAGTVTAVRTLNNNINSFGDFGIGFGDGALPVNWLSFHAFPSKNEVGLFWKTASETDNDYFLAEHSVNGVEFNPVAKIAGSGTTTSVKSYETIHSEPVTGLNYYRIRQVDYNGDFDFSDIIAIQFNKRNSPVIVFPNPASGQAWLLMENAEQTSMEFSVYDLSGRLVLNFNKVLTEGMNEIAIPIHNLSSGVYILKAGEESIRVHRQ